MKNKFQRFLSSEFVALNFYKQFKISDLDFGGTKETFEPISGEKGFLQVIGMAFKVVAFEAINRLWVTNLRPVCAWS